MKIKNWEAILWDCLIEMKNIPDGSIDCIITDPPYKVITWWKNWWNWKPSWILLKNKQLMKEIPIIKDWMKLCFDKLKNNNHAYFMTNMLNLKNMMNEAENAWFYIHNILIWKKNNATPNKWYMKNCEYVIFCKKWKSKFINNCWSKVVEEFSNPQNKIHPTEKPTQLFEMYIKNSTNQWDIILDPFAGSFTSGIACENTNRKWICIEKDEKYFEIGTNRLMK